MSPILELFLYLADPEGLDSKNFTKWTQYSFSVPVETSSDITFKTGFCCRKKIASFKVFYLNTISRYNRVKIRYFVFDLIQSPNLDT